MPDIAVTLLIVAVLLVAVSVLQPLAERLALPHTVLIATLGVALGVLSTFVGYVDHLGPIGDLVGGLAGLEFDARAFLYLFLPVLLFQAGLTIDVRRMMDDVGPILLLAVVAVLVCTGLVGLALWATSGQTILVCLLVGAIIATTDPAAVVGIFRDVGAPRRLSILVEGESLLNDAAAIALFIVLIGAMMAPEPPGLLTGVWLFVVGFLGGVLAGAVFARLAVFVLAPLRNRPLAETTVTVGLAYAAFVVADVYLGVSGVVSVVAAALVMASSGRARVNRRSWESLITVWDQLGYWASSMIFIFGAMLVPELLGVVGWWDLLLILVIVVAAVVARAGVLYVLLPALTAAGISERVSSAYKGVILWGGLRGAVTLALALAVTQLNELSPEVRRFVAVLSTGFVLFTLLVQATTLRVLIRWLGLDQLTPADRVLRDRAVALALDTVADKIDVIGRDYHLEALADDVSTSYRARQAETAAEVVLPLSVSDQISIGLVALAAREEELYREHYADQTISRRTVTSLLAKAGRLRDGAKIKGAEGYMQAARDSLQFRINFRVAQWGQRWFGWGRPLAGHLADRFEMLGISRMVIEELLQFVRMRLGRVLTSGARSELKEVLQQRLDGCDQALDALRLQYPDYERQLGERLMRRAGLRLEEDEYRLLRDEAVISHEVYNDLRRHISQQWRNVARRPRLDLGLATDELVKRFPMFSELADDSLRELTSAVSARFAYPGQQLVTTGERGDAMFFISTGAVEVRRRGAVHRLGSGDFFGEMALLTGRRRSATVVALAYCQLLVLQGRDFRRFVKTHPELRRRIREVADQRSKAAEKADRTPGKEAAMKDVGAT